MPELKVIRPVTEAERQAIDMNKVVRYWSICEVTRQIYQFAALIDDPKAKEIMNKARDVVVLAKRMNNKLLRYKKARRNGFINLNPNTK